MNWNIVIDFLCGVTKFFRNLFAMGKSFHFKDKLGRLYNGIVSFFKFLVGWIKMPGGRYPRTVEKLVEVMIPIFDINFEQDEIVLNNGTHEIFVPVCGKVKRVWFSFTDVRCIPVCQGSADLVGISIRPDGFVINAEINSDRRGIRYFAVIKKDHEGHHDDHDDNDDDDFDFTPEPVKPAPKMPHAPEKPKRR